MTLSADLPLRIIPLGGVGEIGKNMFAFEYGHDIVVIDSGLMFPDAPSPTNGLGNEVCSRTRR